MGSVLSHMTMSLDGFIADPHDGIDELFGWYGAGTVTVATADENMSFRVSEAEAELLRTLVSSSGALVCGRRLFDITKGWGDCHPMGVPVVVVTHRPPDDAGKWATMSFAPTVEDALERARGIAGEKDVCISSADIAGQALELGLLDEIAVSLVPVVLGRGIRYFDRLAQGPYRLGEPTVIPGPRATHLRYPVERP